MSRASTTRSSSTATARAPRPRVRALSGQKWLPVIEFEDGRAYRAESDEMAARVRAGQLFD